MPPGTRQRSPFCQTVVELLSALWGGTRLSMARPERGELSGSATSSRIESGRVYSSCTSPIRKAFKLNWSRRLEPDLALEQQP
jgi:hypothetical protein